MKLIFKIHKKYKWLKKEERRLINSIRNREYEKCILDHEYDHAKNRNVDFYRSIAEDEESYESKLRQKEKELDQREEELNEMQRKLNDQILKLGIVNGVNN